MRSKPNRWPSESCASITGAVAFALGMGVMYTPPKWGWAALGALLSSSFWSRSFHDELDGMPYIP
jgi:hypothetical protein